MTSMTEPRARTVVVTGASAGSGKATAAAETGVGGGRYFLD